MLCWSYIAAVVTEPGRVPRDWTPFATAEVHTDNLGAFWLLQTSNSWLSAAADTLCSGFSCCCRAPQEAALAADRMEASAGRGDKGVAGSGRPRYCRKCQAYQPFQACSICNPVWSNIKMLHLGSQAEMGGQQRVSDPWPCCGAGLEAGAGTPRQCAGQMRLEDGPLLVRIKAQGTSTAAQEGK